jgi:hypothetical protein
MNNIIQYHVLAHCRALREVKKMRTASQSNLCADRAGVLQSLGSILERNDARRDVKTTENGKVIHLVFPK